MEDVLGTPVEALHSRAAGDAACVFNIQPPAAAKAAGRGRRTGKGE
jgi:predicted ArsR family transcriptional regulator